MNRRKLMCAVAMGATLAAGCQVSKSSNPLSPSIAGPIAGVNISQPAALEPGQDWQIWMRDQPIKLLFSNATSNGQRAITYTVEVATDSGFSTNSIVFKRTGITPDSGTTTTLQLPDPLQTGRTYWWHVRAEDGANTSDFSKATSFVAVTPVVLGAPTPASPVGTIQTSAADIKVQAGSESGPTNHIVYEIQVGNDQAFSSLFANLTYDKTGAETVVSNYQFINNKTYYWRVRAKDIGDSQAVSAWSNTVVFNTAQPASSAPSGGGGGGSVGNGDWASCGSTPGLALVQCVRSAVYTTSTAANAFEVTKRVAWLLRNSGFGLLTKDGGENVITWQGHNLSVSRIARPNGGIVKVLGDAGDGGANSAAWDTSLDYPGSVSPSLYVPSIDPSLP